MNVIVLDFQRRLDGSQAIAPSEAEMRPSLYYSRELMARKALQAQVEFHGREWMLGGACMPIEQVAIHAQQYELFSMKLREHLGRTAAAELNHQQAA